MTTAFVTPLRHCGPTTTNPLKDTTKWLPSWLYEHLPHLYAAAALARLVVFGASLAASVSALLFVCAASLTVLQRRRTRTPPVPRAGPRAARR